MARVTYDSTMPKSIHIYTDKNKMFGPYKRKQTFYAIRNAEHHVFVLDEHGNYIKQKENGQT